MKDVIVSFEELKILSGYKLAKSVCAWLETNRIPHIKNANGHPIVSTAVFRQALGESLGQGSTPPVKRSINIDAMEKATSR